MKLETGDILTFDYPVARPLRLEINGRCRYHGQVVNNGRKRAFLLDHLQLPEHGERDSRQPLKSTVAPLER